MTQPPIRLLEGTDASAAERALLEAGRSVPAVRYDVAAGTAKFQAALQGVATAAPAATTTMLAKTATLTKLAVVLVPTLGAVAAYYAMRPAPQPIASTAQAVAVAPAVVESAAPEGLPTAASTPTLERAPQRPIDPGPAQAKPARAPIVRRETASHGTPRRNTISPRTNDMPTPQVSGSPVGAETAATTEVEAPAEELAAPEEPTPAPREEPTPAVAADSINELRGIASARSLIERDPAAALVILQRLSRVHPNGYFVEERAALTVLALAASDDEEAARKQAAKFLKTYPASPFADRVRHAVR
jgi:hypothetical protein